MPTWKSSSTNRSTTSYEANAANGLVIDKTAPDWPASIAAIGLALRHIPLGSSAVILKFGSRDPQCVNLYPGPLSARPGSAAVVCPPSTTGTPFTNT